MDRYTLLRIGAFVNELEHLREKHGIWLQGAELHIPTQTDAIATIGAGGGSYAIQLEDEK